MASLLAQTQSVRFAQADTLSLKRAALEHPVPSLALASFASFVGIGGAVGKSGSACSKARIAPADANIIGFEAGRGQAAP